MRKLLYITILAFLSYSINDTAYAESKIANKIFGSKDCSQYSTKTMSGLSEYVRCKKGLEPRSKNFLKGLGLKGKKNKEFDPNKPCDEYSTKTFTGLAAKMKCKRAKKN